MVNIINNIFIFIIILSYISNIIIIPFRTLNPLLYDNADLLELIKNSSDKSIVETLSKNLIYADLNIGKNMQTIQTFIEMNSKDLIIKDILIHDDNKKDKKTNSDFALCDNNLLNKIFIGKYYNSSNSESYVYVRDCYDYIYDKSLFNFIYKKNICANESIFVKHKQNINDKETIKQIEIYTVFSELNNNDQRPGILGLNYNNGFIPVLKKQSGIKGNYFTFKFHNPLEDKGDLIIGDLPHIYDSINYEEKNLRSAMIIKYNDIKWSLNFDIYASSQNKDKNQTHLAIDELSYFYIEESFITGSDSYYKFIDVNFFKKYIDKKICKKEYRYRSYYGNSYINFICYIENEDKRKEFFKEFPLLILHQKQMNYKFYFDYKDLFTVIPDGKRILFNVDFLSNCREWIIGKPFFKKYQLIFNSDSDLISYYIQPNNLDNNIEIGNNERKGLKIFLIIFLTILVFVLGIIFGRALCSKYIRKIRANELEDNYSYIGKDINSLNNQNDSKNITLDNIDKFKSKYYNLN